MKIQFEKNLAAWDRAIRFGIGAFLLVLATVNLDLPIITNWIIAIIGISQIIEGTIGY
ncbi:MAG: YgaP-like transmembrane domain [Bacillota bacterium]